MFKYHKKYVFVLTELPYVVAIYGTITRNILLIVCVLVTNNDANRMLHNISRFMSANEGLVATEIPTFQALIRRNVYGFVQRCLKSLNNWIKSVMNSNSFCLSKYYEYHNRTLLM